MKDGKKGKGKGKKKDVKKPVPPVEAVKD